MFSTMQQNDQNKLDEREREKKAKKQSTNIFKPFCCYIRKDEYAI